MDIPVTRETTAYECIKEQILQGNLPAAQFLSQRKLAAMAGANVVTMRSALKRLEKDGLLEYFPKWGFRIPAETPETLADRFYVRKILETAAVQRIIDCKLLDPAGSEKSAAAARELLHAAEQCDMIDSDPHGKASEYAEAHSELHRRLVSAAGSPMLNITFSRVTILSYFYMNTRAMWKALPTRYQGHHSEFIRMILSGSREEALDALDRHIDAGMANELRNLEAAGR